MVEHEIRAMVDNPSAIRKTLKVQGFRKISALSQIDKIIDDEQASYFRSGRKFRVRLEGDAAQITYKGLADYSKKISTREEVNITTDPDSAEKLIRLFDEMGFCVVFQIPKIRETYSDGQILAQLDRWPILDWVLELEGDPKTIKLIADQNFGNLNFGNERLKAMIEKRLGQKNITFQKAKEQFESENNVKLGSLELIMSD